MPEATVLIVPGLRDEVAEHWQTKLAARLSSTSSTSGTSGTSRVRCVPPMGREDLDCTRRVAAIEHEARFITGPIIVVAHSGGCIMVAHWAKTASRAVGAVQGALLATPPDFETPMPAGYPALEALAAGGWLPVPRARLPFRSIVGASRNDPLALFGRAAELAIDWGSELFDLGEVGHLNPASGHGEWPAAETLIARLTTVPAAHVAAH